MPPSKKPVKVIHRKLGREQAHAIATIGKDVIEVDERINGYRYLLYMLHEHTHLLHPDWSETAVIKESRKTARFLWDNGFRWSDLKK